MKLGHAIRDSVRTRLFRSWLILGASAIAASVFVLVLLVNVERGNQKSRIADDLRIKASTVSRRLSAELLVGDRGNVDPVIGGLRQELSIETIILLPPGVDCAATPAAGPCESLVRDPYVWTTERLPHLPDTRYVFLAQSRTLLATAVPWTTVLVATLSLLGLLLGGIIFQWSAIRRHLLRPINALLETGSKRKDSEEWPVEIRRIETKLRTLLEERDKATTEAHRLKTEHMVHDLSQRILHDLKAPLGTLGMMIETDLQQVPAETKDSIRRVLGRIRAIVDSNLKEYSADVLARSVEPANPAPFVEKPSSTVGGAVRAILEEEQSKAALRGIEMVSDVPRGIFQTFAPISYSELCRVFSNLVTNAVDAAERGRKKVYVTAQVADSYCEITIRDFGLGFDPLALQRIQAGERGSTKPKGSGLGLLTAKSLIEQAGGTLQIQTFEDGALLRVRLPILETPTWFQDITRTRSEMILALDDDATIARQLAATFPGKKISLFQSEELFLADAESNPSALLLVDFDYGGKRTGLDLILNRGLTRRAVLVSGKIAFDTKLRSTAQAQGVRMFPKECLA